MMFRLALLAMMSIPESLAIVHVCAVWEYGFCTNITATGPLPTVVVDGIDVEGYDVDMRLEVFGRLGYDYEVMLYSSYAEVILRTRSGECDIGWADFYAQSERESCTAECKGLNDTSTMASPLPSWMMTTSRQCCVDMGVLYIQNGLALLYKQDNPDRKSVLESINAPILANAVSLIFIVIVMAGHIIWALERHKNPENFPTAYLDGIDDGVWWAAVTLTTVGYGDKVPNTPAGRSFALILMFAGLVISGIFVGVVSSAVLSATDATSEAGVIDSWDDVRDSETICTFPWLYSLYLGGVNAQFVMADSFSECASNLRAKTATMVYMDTPIMLSALSAYEIGLRESYSMTHPFSFSRVAIMFPEMACTNETTSSLQDKVDATMLEIFAEPEFDLPGRWFGEAFATNSHLIADGGGDNDDIEDNDDGALGLATILSIVMVVAYAALQSARTCLSTLGSAASNPREIELSSSGNVAGYEGRRQPSSLDVDDEEADPRTKMNVFMAAAVHDHQLHGKHSLGDTERMILALSEQIENLNMKLANSRDPMIVPGVMTTVEM